MKKTRILSLILVFAMIFSVVGFAEDLSEQEIASKLNQINLVSGDGTGLNLDGELTRAEAATFIVKLIGREKTVLSSPSFYGMTPFTDVKGDEWYAPFVGYCAMNKIISGYPDNTFRADEKLTEKAFLTMVMKSLKYTDQDFNWDNIFLKAYEKGIVKDLSYAVKEADSTLDRGRVLEIEYNALNLFYKDDSMTLLDNLISNGIVTQSKAESLNMVTKDAKKTSIVSAEATSLNEVTVTLNENIANIMTSQITLTSGTINYPVKDVSQNGKVIIVTFDDNLIGDDYDITLVNVIDEENYLIKSISEEVEPYETVEVESDYFRIEKVESVSENIVKVYFTQPVNINASLVLHYEILQNGQTVVSGSYNEMEAAVMGDDDHGVSIFVKTMDFVEDLPYTLKVRGSLTSAYDVNLNEGQDMTADFLGDGSSNKSLKVSDVNVISEDEVRVIFNQDIDVSLATNIGNYIFKDITRNNNSAVISASMGTIGDKQNRTVNLKVIDMIDNHNYELEILNARDIFKASTITGSKHIVEGGEYSTSDVELDYVVPISETKLHLYFDRSLNPASIAASISGVDDVMIVYSASDSYKLTVYLDKDSPLEDNEDYVLKISSGIVDSDGQVQLGTLRQSFEGIDDEEEDIEIDDARFISQNKVKVSFNTEVSMSNKASQYKLQYKNDAGHDVSITADSINYVDSKTAIMSFSNIPEETYVITAYNMVDPSNQYTTYFSSADVEKE